MKLQILVSSLNQEVKSLAEKMNLQADAILINQCNENRYEEWTQDGHRIRCYHLAERGVGLSRNNALLRADADLCLFSDEDIVYDDGAVERIIERRRLLLLPPSDWIIQRSWVIHWKKSREKRAAS